MFFRGGFKAYAAVEHRSEAVIGMTATRNPPLRLNGAPFSALSLGLHIASPALLMLCLSMLETYVFPVLPWGLSRSGNGSLASVLIALGWVIFLPIRLRRCFAWRWFFAWWPLLSVLGLFLFLVLAALAGMPIGREERFPAVLAVLPVAGLLLLTALGSFLFYVVKHLWGRRRSAKEPPQPTTGRR